MGKSAPKAPSPRETSAAQTGTNVATAVANSWMTNMNEYGPDGSKTFAQTGSSRFTDPYTGKSYSIPRFSVTQTLSPEQRGIKAQNDRASLNMARLGADQSAKIGSLLGTSINLRGLPQVPTAAPTADRAVSTYNTDFSQDRQRVEEALMSRLNPQIMQDRESLRTNLANQGIREGSEAFDRAMSRADQQTTDARMQAILAGGQEQSRMVGLEAARAGFENSAIQQNFQNDLSSFGAQGDLRSRALQEAFAVRNQPINEIAALMSGGQVSMPQFMTGANVNAMPTTDNAALINSNYQQRLQAWQQKQAAIGGALSGVGGLFAAL